MPDRLRRRLLHTPSADWDARQIRRALRGAPGTDGAVERLEAAAEDVLGIPVIAFGSARSAIAAMLIASRPSSGRVVLPAYTCVAVPNAVRSAGLERVWVDVDGPNLGPRQTEAAVGTGDAVIAQHTYGVPVAAGVVASARACGAFVIEDRAHRFDAAELEGDGAVYSLEHSKVVSGGQGGLAWARDPALAAELRRIRSTAPTITDGAAATVLRTSGVQAGLVHWGGPASTVTGIARRIARRIPVVSAPAQTPDELAGRGVEITAPHPALAEIAIGSVRRAPSTIAHRRAIGDRYRERLGSLVPDWLPRGAAFVRMPILVGDAEAVTVRLLREGWDLGPRWFDAPVHPRGSASDYPPGSAPNAERLASRVMTLPTHPAIDEQVADRLIEAILNVAA